MGRQGYLNIVLHAHLPFVRHPEYDDFLEEDWFFEGMTDSHVPLLIRLERMKSEGVPFKITMTVTPTLATMMDDGHLLGRLYRYMNNRIALLKKEIENPINSQIEKSARFFLNEVEEGKDFLFRRYEGRLLGCFKKLEESGHLEIMTSAATHGFLPLMSTPEICRAQIKTGIRHHEHFFGKKPKGFWLPECGYDHGIDELLVDEGIEYSILDTHGLYFGNPVPIYGIYAPIITPAHLSIFGRDPGSSSEVWSPKHGFPGDPQYREFYRDLGFETEFDYIRPFLHSDRVRRNVGIKYYRITGNVGLNKKAYYDPNLGREKAAEHAQQFIQNRRDQIRSLENKTKDPPIITAPFDAELFGHWWYEGPQFLEFVIRKLAYDQDEIELISGADYLKKFPVRQQQTPSPSTWGLEGGNQIWINGGNEWIHPHQYQAESRMLKLVSSFPQAQGIVKRALNQLLRELLLLQSSDWAFIMTANTTTPYAVRRFREHLGRFNTLADQISEKNINPGYLDFLENQDQIFPKIDYRDIVSKNTSKNKLVYS